MANFSSILDRPGTEIERPKPLPVGSYLCILKGMPRYDKSSKKQTDFVEFTAQPLRALEDVDAEALEAVGGLENKTIKCTFYITEDATWRLKEFLAACGFDVDDPDTSLRQQCEQTPNSEVYVTLRHEASQDGKAVFARPADYARVE